MDLLEKFNAVEVKTDDRITQRDKDFCERHQAAYENAVTSYTGMLRLWLTLHEKQKELLGDAQGEHYDRYLCRKEDVRINSYGVKSHVDELHSLFIKIIIEHFCETRGIELNEYCIINALLKNPDDVLKQPEEKWSDMPRQMAPIRYEAIVDLIYKQMDGQSFDEYAMSQMKENCHDAVRGFGRDAVTIERKKAVIRLRGAFCYTHLYYGREEWNIQDRLKSILKAAAYYETGEFGNIPERLWELIKGETQYYGYAVFTGCQKLLELQMYKNGRVDLTFTTEEDARMFYETYLSQQATS